MTSLHTPERSAQLRPALLCIVPFLFLLLLARKRKSLSRTRRTQKLLALGNASNMPRVPGAAVWSTLGLSSLIAMVPDSSRHAPFCLLTEFLRIARCCAAEKTRTSKHVTDERGKGTDSGSWRRWGRPHEPSLQEQTSPSVLLRSSGVVVNDLEKTDL